MLNLRFADSCPPAFRPAAEEIEENFASITSDAARVEQFPSIIQTIQMLAQGIPPSILKRLPWDQVHYVCLEQMSRTRLKGCFSDKAQFRLSDGRHKSLKVKVFCDEAGENAKYSALVLNHFLGKVLHEWPEALSYLSAEELRQWDGVDHKKLSIYPASLSIRELSLMPLQIWSSRDENLEKIHGLQAEIAAYRLASTPATVDRNEMAITLQFVRKNNADFCESLEQPEASTEAQRRFIVMSYYLSPPREEDPSELDSFHSVLCGFSEKEMKKCSLQVQGLIRNGKTFRENYFLREIPEGVHQVPRKLLTAFITPRFKEEEAQGFIDVSIEELLIGSEEVPPLLSSEAQKKVKSLFLWGLRFPETASPKKFKDEFF